MPYASLTLHGYTQKLTIPRKYRLPGKRVKISHYGGGILVEPLIEEGFAPMFEALSMFSDDFLTEERQQPPLDNRDDFFV